MSLLSPEKEEKIIAMLKKYGLEPVLLTPGVWTKGQVPNARLVDLKKYPPEVALWDGKTRYTEGHGIEELYDIQRGIENILDQKSNGDKQKETPAPDVERANTARGPATEETVNQKAVDNPAEQHKQNLPARQEKAKPPAKKSDAEIDAEIEKAKAERFLSQRGSSYKVQGKERPDSHMIQKIANDKGVCIEIIEAYQNDEYAHVVVRGHLNDQYVDAIVHHDFKTEYLLKIMEIARKNPHIIDHWEGTNPVLKADAVIESGDRENKEKVSAQYFVTHALLSFKKFALRDGRTKAASIAEAMLLNRDWRDEEERQSEEAEAELVQENIKNRKGVNA